MSGAVKTRHTERARYTFRFKRNTPKRILREVEEHYGKYIVGSEDEVVDWFKTEEHARIAADMTPGKHLRTLRQMTGMTQAQVAEKLGVSPARVSDFECDRVAMGRAMAKRAAALFGTSPAVFI
ncbi:MAG: helix-turn-helix domain-containing protein [Chitinivibrionales bacterium]|nr:helix-turn-helix domain-containing protein [Chitinivibrionales bacterium]